MSNRTMTSQGNQAKNKPGWNHIERTKQKKHQLFSQSYKLQVSIHSTNLHKSTILGFVLCYFEPNNQHFFFSKNIQNTL